jgi:hypothetical protein
MNDQRHGKSRIFPAINHVRRLQAERSHINIARVKSDARVDRDDSKSSQAEHPVPSLQHAENHEDAQTKIKSPLRLHPGRFVPDSSLFQPTLTKDRAHDVSLRHRVYKSRVFRVVPRVGADGNRRLQKY